MNIGMDVSFLRKPGTGIGQVTANFLEAFAKHKTSDALSRNSKLFLYCEEEPGKSITLPEHAEIRVFLPVWKRDDVPRRIFWERALAKKATKDSCDIFLSLSQSSTRFPSSSPIRHVMVVHDIIPRLFPEYLGSLTRTFHWNAIERGIRDADRVIAVSEATKTDLLSKLGIPKEKIAVAYPDCDPVFHNKENSADTDRVMQKYALKQGYIYHGGGLEIRKNAERLLRAYAALRKSTREAEIPPLVVSGKVFPSENRLATDVLGIMSQLGLEKSVTLLGFVPKEDLPALYRGASMFVYPSLYEGFGLPILEAFASGTPVIAGNTGSIPEIAGDAALLVDPTSADTIAESMARLRDDSALRAELREKGRRRAEDFSWDSFLETTLHLLRDIKRS